jgi:hypothetical protein
MYLGPTWQKATGGNESKEIAAWLIEQRKKIK